MLDRISEQEGVGVFACNAVKRKVGQEITTVTTCYDLRGEHFQSPRCQPSSLHIQCLFVLVLFIVDKLDK